MILTDSGIEICVDDSVIDMPFTCNTGMIRRTIRQISRKRCHDHDNTVSVESRWMAVQTKKGFEWILMNYFGGEHDSVLYTLVMNRKYPPSSIPKLIRMTLEDADEDTAYRFYAFDSRRGLLRWLLNEECVNSIRKQKTRKQRSDDQNAWLWGGIYPMLLKGLLDAGWEFTRVEQVHEYFKALLTGETVVNKHTGEIVKFPSSTAAMDTATFYAYCEKLRDYAQEYLNMEIPDPNRK
ncbi:MAG: hypothetical protein LBK07_11845 [Tannerella sp.]|nr:hypothetical protein [Tannerella sp.]